MAKVWWQRCAAILARGWLLPALLLALGLSARLGWLLVTEPHGYAQGEMANVAIAFAKTGTLADAYRPGQGPTAHVLPLPPLYAGLIYRAFGIRSAVSEAILAAASIGMVLLSFALLYRVFGEMGTSRAGLLLGLATACLLPLNFALEVVGFRIWEGALATVLGLAFLYALLRLDHAAEIGTRTIALMSLAAAVLFFVSPALGLAGYACSLLLLVDRLPVKRWPAALAIAAAALVIVIGPWAVRNQSVLGEPVLLRSNFGLELAIGNHPAAATTSDDGKAFRARLDEVHPFQSQAAFDAMQRAGGEVAYARQLGATARAWIAENPAAFARLSLKHIQQYFFPPAWQWSIYSDPGRALRSKVALHWAVTAVGLAGALFALFRATRRYRYAVTFLLVPALMYAITQPVPRYRYIMYGLTLFFAGDLIGYLLTWSRIGAELGAEPGHSRPAGAPS